MRFSLLLRPSFVRLRFISIYSNYFRVAFYGNRWPASVSGKQFIYRGQGLETLGSFIEKMLNKHAGFVSFLSPSTPFSS